MKTRIAKVLGIVLTITLLSSLAMVAAPVTAAPGVNTWGMISAPPFGTGTDVGVMEVVESDGTIFAAQQSAGVWSVVKSSDGGATWGPTAFGPTMANPFYITDIVASPNYAVDGKIYVSTINGLVYCIGGKGADTPILLQAPQDSNATTASAVFDLDLWYDGSNVWILAATNLDVLVFRHALLEEWRDMEVQPSPIPTVAFEAAFAPDFNTSNLMWAVVMGGITQVVVTSTISPSQWGNTIANVTPLNASGLMMGATMWCELDFAETYNAATPVVYLANSGPNTGNLFEIRGSYVPAGTTAIPLLPVDTDCISVEVSGNVILIGTYGFWGGGVLRSDNLANTFNPATKPPSGVGLYEVEMAPGMFDPDEGVAYCSTAWIAGDESAFSITEDGGQTWNQTFSVDTIGTSAADLAFSPITASQPAFVITSGGPIDSLWRTEDITASVATWVRVQYTRPAMLVQFYAVAYSMDGTNVMLYGQDSGGNYEIWKSTDNGQTFNLWRTLNAPADEIMDWVVYDGSTVFCALDDANGFLGTTLFGPNKVGLPGVSGVSIALQPGFDPDDPANSVVLLGDDSGNIFISGDAGTTWSAPQNIGSGDVYVAFDALFGDNGLVYFATSGSTVGQAAVNSTATGLTGVTTLKDSNLDTATAAAGFTGIRVAPDNALYAIGGDQMVNPGYDEPAEVSGTIDLLGDDSANDVNGVAIALQQINVISGTFVDAETINVSAATLAADSSTIVSGTIYLTGATSSATGSIDVTIFTAGFNMGEGVTIDASALTCTVDTIAATTVPGTTDLYRLLLHEPMNVWELENRNNAMGLWLTEGSNFVYTIVSGSTPYALMDTLSGPVTGVTVTNIGETTAVVSWNAMTGATAYQVLVPAGATFTSTGATSGKLSGLTNNTSYTVKVRVAPDKMFSSRWSAAAAFTTLEAIAVPIPRVPAQGLQNAPLLPSFVWDAVTNAVSYDFELSTDPAFASTIISTSVTVSGYTFAGPDLAYDTNHYWRVRAKSATGTISAWCTIQNFHTRTEEEPPIVLPDPVTPVVTVNLPQPTVTVVPPDVNVTVAPPDVIVDIPPIVTVTEAPPITLELPEREAETPVYIWIIVGIGAVLTISVIVLIIRTRRVV